MLYSFYSAIRQAGILKALLPLVALLTFNAAAQEAEPENASSPLAKVRNTDLKARFVDIDGDDLDDYALEGALMINPKLKFRYELRYWETDVTGQQRSGLDSARAKGIYFPGEGKWNDMPYRLAVGLEAKVHFDNQDRGIGQDAHTLIPFAGVAVTVRPGTIVIPLIQHEGEIDGVDVSITSLRLLAIQKLPNRYWLKLDAIASADWENDNDLPASAELQFGRQFTPSFGVYAEALTGIGGYKSYDWGFGLGLRFNY